MFLRTVGADCDYWLPEGTTMDEVWTHATWIVKGGREGEFVETWREMAAQG